MYNYDLYTGEPSYDGSPPKSQNELSQQEIVNNANMMFYTDPDNRYQQMQQQQMGYQQPYYGYGYGYQQPQQPYYYGQQQNPYMNQPSGFSGYAGNPAYQYMQSTQPQQTYYTPHTQDYVYYVQGYNPGGANRMLLPSDAKEICDQLQIQMNNELEDDYEKRLEQQREYYGSLGYNNYYGMPYAQQYNPAIINKYRQKIEDMRKEAEARRVEFNKHLSKLCHNYRGDDIDEETIDAIYDGYTITIPGCEITDTREYQRMCSAQEIDTSIPIKIYDAYASEPYTKYVNNDTDMNTFFTVIGQVITDKMLEEEKHRRRDLSSISMSTSTYRELIRKKVDQRNERNNNFVIPPMDNGENIPMGRNFPTLNESARFLDDGTLDIHAPAWLGNKEYVIKNGFEDEYELNRHKFVDSIYGSSNPLNGGFYNNGG